MTLYRIREIQSLQTLILVLKNKIDDLGGLGIRDEHPEAADSI
jgi:hypothetical protein